MPRLLHHISARYRKGEIAGAFLLACSFTDAGLLGLNSLRFSRLRIDRGWASPYGSSLMRPCDGMSGLVRGSRRKAVFAFKGLFSGRVFLLRFPSLAARVYHVFRKCGENRKPSSATRFSATKPQVAEAQNRGEDGRSWFFPHFRKCLTEVCGKFQNPRAHRLFRVRKPLVEALSLPDVVGMSGFCRILPF